MSGDTSGPLRVLLLLHNLDFGGAERAVCDMARELSGLGCQPVLCGWRRGGAYEAGMREAGVPVEVPPREPTGWRRLNVPGYLCGVVHRHRIDLIHAHLSDAATWAVLLQWCTERPCIISHRSNDLIDTVGQGRPLYGWVRRRLLFFCAQRAAANVAITAAVRDALVAQAQLAPERISVVPNGLPPLPRAAVSQACEQRRRRALSRFTGSSGPTILFAGRLESVKDLDTLIAAAPRLLKEYPTAFVVLLGDGPDRAALQARVHRLGLGERILFPGSTVDVGPWFAKADVYASASRTEGLSGAVLEAMAWGVPVVASDIPGHRELLLGGAGVLFPVGAPDLLAGALIATLQDGPATAARVERAITLVSEQYHINLMARRHLQIYRAVIEANGPHRGGLLRTVADTDRARPSGGWS